jgi:putative NADH-flavin reductase
VKVMTGDAFSPDAIARTLEGADAVLSGLGARSLGKEDVLERAVPLIVRATEASAVKRMLTNGAARGTYRVDGEALPRNGAMISRADVAEFMLEQLTTAEWSRKGVYLSW